jgi:hypothetical protein
MDVKLGIRSKEKNWTPAVGLWDYDGQCARYTTAYRTVYRL